MGFLDFLVIVLRDGGIGTARCRPLCAQLCLGVRQVVLEGGDLLAQLGRRRRSAYLAFTTPGGKLFLEGAGAATEELHDFLSDRIGRPESEVQNSPA